MIKDPVKFEKDKKVRLGKAHKRVLIIHESEDMDVVDVVVMEPGMRYEMAFKAYCRDVLGEDWRDGEKYLTWQGMRGYGFDAKGLV